tara:strand:+ start:301 stop:1476 length:1176 start_codon:yes stop_codon:yes gene_type:complete
MAIGERRDFTKADTGAGIKSTERRDFTEVDTGADITSGVSASNIFGWSWLGQWADNDTTAPARAQEFILEWVKKFNTQVIQGGSEGAAYVEEAFINEFLVALNKETWWAEQTAVWQAVQKLRYDPLTPGGEYERLVKETAKYVTDYLRMQGLDDLDPENKRIRDFAENLILTASDVGSNGFPVLNADEANRQIEEKLFGDDGFTTKPSPQAGSEFDSSKIGPGALQDLFDSFKSIATQNYIAIDDEDIWNLVQGVKTEQINWQTAYNEIIRRVGDQYGFLSGSSILDRIDNFSYSADTSTFGGSSLNSHLSPIRTTLADVWELDASEVKLQDVFGKQLNNLILNEDGDERFMNSREVSRWARAQPQFEKTDAYKSGMSGLTGTLLKMFGAR